MVELSILSKYPFLNASKDYVKVNNLIISEILNDPLYERARLIGIERLDNAFNKRDVGTRSCVTQTDHIMELLSYPISRMIAVCIGDTFFKRRYALGEAVHAYKNLVTEPISFLLFIAKEFNLNVKYFKDSNKISIFFIDYLNYAPTRYKEWKMINRELKNGQINISKKDLARLIQEALRARINEELDSKQSNRAICDAFLSDIRRIQNTVLLHRKKIEAMPIGRLDSKKLPPCMKDILS